MSKYDQEYYVLIPEIIYYNDGEMYWDEHYMTFYAKDRRTDRFMFQEKPHYPDRALYFASYYDEESQLEQRQLNWSGGEIGDINKDYGDRRFLLKKWIYDIVRPYEIAGVQFLYSIYENSLGDYYEPLYFMNFYEFSNAWHRERSQYTKWHLEELKEDPLDKPELEKLSLDEKILDTIALERRLIFRLDNEYLRGGWTLFHKSLVDKITERGIKGAKFVRVDEWTPESKKPIYTGVTRVLKK